MYTTLSLSNFLIQLSGVLFTQIDISFKLLPKIKLIADIKVCLLVVKYLNDYVINQYSLIRPRFSRGNHVGSSEFYSKNSIRNLNVLVLDFGLFAEGFKE